jgi:hypothetical protein
VTHISDCEFLGGPHDGTHLTPANVGEGELSPETTSVSLGMDGKRYRYVRDPAKPWVFRWDGRPGVPYRSDT